MPLQTEKGEYEDNNKMDNGPLAPGDKRKRINSQYAAQNNQCRQSLRDQQDDIQSVISSSLAQVNGVLNNVEIIQSLRKNSSLSRSPNGRQRFRSGNDNELKIEECEIDQLPEGPRGSDNRLSNLLFKTLGPSHVTKNTLTDQKQPILKYPPMRSTKSSN